MKHSLSRFALSILSAVTLAGCGLIEAIGDIFKAGVWVGVILVFVVVGIIAFVVSRVRA